MSSSRCPHCQEGNISGIASGPCPHCGRQVESIPESEGYIQIPGDLDRIRKPGPPPGVYEGLAADEECDRARTILLWSSLGMAVLSVSTIAEYWHRHEGKLEPITLYIGFPLLSLGAVAVLLLGFFGWRSYAPFGHAVGALVFGVLMLPLLLTFRPEGQRGAITLPILCCYFLYRACALSYDSRSLRRHATRLMTAPEPEKPAILDDPNVRKMWNPAGPDHQEVAVSRPRGMSPMREDLNLYLSSIDLVKSSLIMAMCLQAFTALLGYFNLKEDPATGERLSYGTTVFAFLVIATVATGVMWLFARYCANPFWPAFIAWVLGVGTAVVCIVVKEMQLTPPLGTQFLVNLSTLLGLGAGVQGWRKARGLQSALEQYKRTGTLPDELDEANARR